MVDEQLRAPLEEVCQRSAPFVGVEAVVLLDLDPRQFLAPTSQLVAAARQFLFVFE
jgi:hypothetical protein